MRIAVIGAGVSGLVAARLLSRENDVSVFEAEEYAGGPDQNPAESLLAGLVWAQEVHYSHLKACIGSIWTARRAGR